MDGGDLRAVAASVLPQLRACLGADWSAKPEGLDWTCHQLGDHLSAVMLSYAVHAAARTERELPLVGRRLGADDPAAYLDLSEAAAEVLAATVDAMGEGDRAWHPAGIADASGFAAMACDELLIHGSEMVQALGGAFHPPEDLAGEVLRRLFPWAPTEAEPWSALLWANGRLDLPERAAQGAAWVWHCAPLEEWDGSIPEWDVHG